VILLTNWYPLIILVGSAMSYIGFLAAIMWGTPICAYASLMLLTAGAYGWYCAKKNPRLKSGALTRVD
jgi:hypothetical protein